MNGIGTGRWLSSKLGFLVSLDKGVLLFKVDREFAETAGVGHWARELAERYPGPHQRLVIDVRALKDFKSTLFAELLHLRDAYSGNHNPTPLILNASRRMIQLMEIMSISHMFEVQPSPQ